MRQVSSAALRAYAIGFLGAALAVLLVAVTWSVTQPRQEPGLLWGGTVYTSKQEFNGYLKSKELSYKTWVARNPGAAPWEPVAVQASTASNVLKSGRLAPRTPTHQGSEGWAARLRLAPIGFAIGLMLVATGCAVLLLRGSPPVTARVPKASVPGFRLKRRAVGEPLLEHVDAELILLREENARLKAERQRGPNVGALVESVRNVTAASAVAEDRGDDAWDVLTEAMVMREVLMDVTREIECCMLTLQNRLRPLEPGGRFPATAHGAGNGNANGHVPLYDAGNSNRDGSLLIGTLALTVGEHNNRQGD